jgi:hypothetical protein
VGMVCAALPDCSCVRFLPVARSGITFGSGRRSSPPDGRL